MNSDYFCFMISFENTEVAFRGKSDKELKRAHWLFKMVANPGMVKFGKWATNVSMKIHLPIKGIIKKTIFQQFCGGETIKESLSTSRKLADRNVKTILDYSIEGKTAEEDFEKTVDEIIATILEAKNNKHIPFAVFKTTGISLFRILEAANDGLEKLSEAERDAYDKVFDRVDRIAKAAHENNVPLFIDAEETWIQNTIDNIVYQMSLRYNQERAIVYNTVQMYRHDRLEFMKRELARAQNDGIYLGFKIVRGAYMEKERERAEENGYPSPIQPDKASTDMDFNAALELCIKNIDRVAICAGTHNEESSLLLTKLVEENGIAKDDKRVFFAQLLGMSDHISFNLADEGYEVAKYVPYGPIKEVLPYLIRRAEENTSVAGQTGRELSLIKKEISRRSALK
jgi:proline dehydrogenase